MLTIDSGVSVVALSMSSRLYFNVVCLYWVCMLVFGILFKLVMCVMLMMWWIILVFVKLRVLVYIFRMNVRWCFSRAFASFFIFLLYKIVGDKLL